MICAMPSPKAPHGELPPHIAHDPEMLHWRVTNLEQDVAELQDRPSLPQLPGDFPWVRALLLLFLLALGLKGSISPETALTYAGRLFGIASRE